MHQALLVRKNKMHAILLHEALHGAGYQISRLLTAYYCDVSGKELGRCMAIYVYYNGADFRKGEMYNHC